MDTDQIEREVVIDAPVERVWQVLTEAEHIAGWFGDSARIDLRVGGDIVFGWASHGTFHATIERLEPPRVLAYRWAYEPDTTPQPGNSTLVEFTLSPEGAGTRLRLVETGFAALDVDEDERRKRHADNVEGWRVEIGELRQYVLALQ